MNFDPAIVNQKYLNLFGGGVDEAEEQVKILAMAKELWPVSPKAGCKEIEDVMNRLKIEIEACQANKAMDYSKGNQRVQNRYIEAYTTYGNELSDIYSRMTCAEIKQEASTDEYFDKQFQVIERTKDLADKGSNLTRYIIFGLLGLVVIVAGVIVFKKSK